MRAVVTTLAGLVHEYAATAGAKEAVVDHAGGLTYQELDARARDIADGLAALGLVEGDIVTVQLPNCADFVSTAVACSYRGYVFSPVGIRYRLAEVEYVLRSSGSTALITPTEFGGFDHAQLNKQLKQSIPGLRTFYSGPSAPDGEMGLPSIAGSVVPPVPPPDLDRPAVILLTSGSESSPKLVLHDERSFGVASAVMVDRCGIVGGDVSLVGIPITTSAGTHGLMWNTLSVGGTLVLLERWSASAAATMIARHKCTYTLAPSSILFDLLALPPDVIMELDSLRLFICGGAPIPRELARRANDMLGCAVTPMYGASECLAATTCAPDEPIEVVISTDGRPLELVRLVAIDDEGVELSAGEAGELAAGGPTLCRGYVEAPGVVRDPQIDGLWRTGDLGFIDESGYVHVVDRKKDVLVRGGINISSKEIEDVLVRHPAIERAAVVGLPDPRLGQRICAFVALRREASTPSLAQLGEFFAAEGVAGYKVPERIERVDELPLNASGKTDKLVLRERAAD